MKLTLFIISAIIISISQSQALADEICDSSCNSGQKLVSFVDGNSLSCICVDESAMVPTVEGDSISQS